MAIGYVTYSVHKEEETITATFDGEVQVKVNYLKDVAFQEAVEETFDTPQCKFSIDSVATDSFVPFSVVFDMGGRRFIDRGDGVVITDLVSSTGAHVEVGEIIYNRKEVVITDSTVDIGDTTLITAIGSTGGLTANTIRFSIDAPLKPGSGYVSATTTSGNSLIANVDQNGFYSDAYMTLVINQSNGYGEVEFAEPVIASTVRFGGLRLVSRTLDKEIVGINPVALPPTGEVPVLRSGGYCAILRNDSVELTDSIIPASTEVTLPFSSPDYAWVQDDKGKFVDQTLYEVDDTKCTFLNQLEDGVDDYVWPLRVMVRNENRVTIETAHPGGTIQLDNSVGRGYPDGTAIITPILLFGDISSYVFNMRDSSAWSGDWDDPGPISPYSYDKLAFPPILDFGAAQESYRIEIQPTSSNVRVYSKTGSVVYDGPRDTPMAIDRTNNLIYDEIPDPIPPGVELMVGLAVPNPTVAGGHLFVLESGGWGPVMWPSGSNLLLDVYAASRPFVVGKTVNRGATSDTAKFGLTYGGSE
jgi:hypothetical protein